MTTRYPAGRTEPELASHYSALGLHGAGLMSHQALRAEADFADRTVLYFEGRSWTRRELNVEANSIAVHLRQAGVEPGDIVCVLASNHSHVVVTALATWQLGAVLLPIVDIYREREIAQVLDELEPAVVVTAATVRGTEVAELFDDLLAERQIVPKARLLLRGSRPGWLSIDEVASTSVRLPPARVTPQEPCLLLLTSGSTGRAKIAVHSSESLLAEAVQMARAWWWTGRDLSYVSVPLSHISGLLRGIVVPVLMNSPVLLRPRWDTEQAVRDITTRPARFTTVPGLILGEFIEHYEDMGCPEHQLKIISVGVSDGTYSAIEAAERHGMHPSRAYGLSELPTATIASADLSTHQRMYTCGQPAPGVDLELRDEAGNPVPDGHSGEVVVRGPEQMLGYLRAKDNEAAWTVDGFIRTGDIGVLDQGSLRLVGRLKDMINRGGEKLSAVEIEDSLRQHPGVGEVAVVPGPDPRLGEVPVAFVVARDPSVVGTDLAAFLLERGLAKQKVPQSWRFVSELPLTASGKIQKGELMARLNGPGDGA